MKTGMKRPLALLLAGGMTLALLTGCGKAGEATEADATETAVNTEESETAPEELEKPAEQKITVSIATNTGLQEGWQAVGEAYTAMHPEVTVVVDLKAGDGYDQWVNNIFASNDTTEVDIVNINYAAAAAADKDIDFNEYLNLDSPYSDGPWVEQFQYDMQQIDASTGGMNALSLESTQVMWFYNQEIFTEVGIDVPTTWPQLIAACEKLEAAGYQPIAMPGDYDSFYSGTMGWLAQIYTDQTTRSMINEYRSQEGDYTYDPDLDTSWTYDPTDPWNDDTIDVTRNPVRFFSAVHDGTYTVDTPGMRTVWSSFAEVFPKYAGGDAMFGTNGDGANSLFYQGKAAMMVNGGWGIVEFANNMAKIGSGETITDSTGAEIADATAFTLGTFAMPSMEGEGIEAPARTIEVASGFLGCVSKNQEHDELVVDLLMYLSSAEGMTVFMDAAIAAGYAPAGPSLVYGVSYPEHIASAFENVKYIGNCQKNYGNSLARGFCELPESTREYYNNAYEFLSGATTVEDFIAGQVKNFETYFEIGLDTQGMTLEDLENPAVEPAGE